MVSSVGTISASQDSNARTMNTPAEINRVLWDAAAPYIKDGNFGTPLDVWTQEFRIWFRHRLEAELLPPKPPIRRAIHPGSHTIESRPDEFWMSVYEEVTVEVSPKRFLRIPRGFNVHWPSVQWNECRWPSAPVESFDPMI